MAVDDDVRIARRADGVLAAANRAGILEPADVHVARQLGDIAAEADPSVVLALALTVRTVRSGSICLDLHEAVDPSALTPVEDTERADDEQEGGSSAALSGREEPAAYRDPDPADPAIQQGLHEDWPTDADAWLRAVQDSALLRSGVLRVEFGLVYLDRYHREEVRVAQILRERATQDPPAVDAATLEAGLLRLFDGETYAEQRSAAESAVRQWTTVLTGGPGTGKTSTVARLLVLLGEQWDASGQTRPLRVALAAPTGKAAARLKESVSQAAAQLASGDAARIQDLDAMTLHRLLGWNSRSSNKIRFNESNRLPHDLIVVDETSMVALTMMSRLLRATRPTSRLVLVGDAEQLASVDAGAVMADLVEGYQQLAPRTVCRLTTSHRFDAEIGSLAAAVRAGDPDRAIALLRAGGEAVSWIEDHDPAPVLRGRLLDHALRLRERAVAGDAAGALTVLGEHRLLCAQRTGPRGVRWWNHLVDEWLSEATGDPLWEPMYVGRPILVTRNDYALGVHNGDTGVVMGGDGAAVAQIGTAAGPVPIAASRLSDIETMHAMTIHKSQGSEAGAITVLLPQEESPLLTKELLYTAVTRAQRHVTIVGSEETVRAAVTAQIRRATGLRRRLGG
ncbi:RecBCD enzyme subunit RecD [Flexivirga endophytica]|uniref:RecBCD enzyme subunit RecD n=1 Tax=Flexivirga endophytica TaxID=1849103 RepID=A0A916SYQ6_9MICO|nr:exodeoxyribonuclease V subunit alpha [Flexivirga endophytica]GGB24017.1 RecBCD enzyme subunit RecD [Flexivirga endophytica]GHB57972.1 RecBCD enzyme subunit RecD [Flexivirga endophytica]